MSGEFGRYRLEAKIGEGSLAEVYRARKEGGPQVALKRLSRAHLDNQELTDVLAREARIATLMQGPGLLGATESGDVEGWPYLVMPIANGGSLEALLKESEGIARTNLRRVATQLADALTAMHGLGYAHGDLSPGNVLLGGDGAVFLVDFGASTQLGHCQSQPQGTFSYMSPEQVRGEIMDAHSDVFSLATLLWECTSGQKIFSREAQHLCFMAVVESDPPAMPLAFSATEQVLRRALSKEPRGRPATPELFCAAFVDTL
ncbi:MAG: serine/threonine protein kinase [Myxococcales bacterium]|nr:serine/threonine protein kinase [Myxococcales bacterium]